MATRTTVRGVAVLLLAATPARAADPTFQARTIAHVGADPFAVAAADLDRDGRMDLVVTDGGGNTVITMRGNGDGTFRPPTRLPAGDTPRGLALGDLNRDGYPDAVVATSHADAVTVFLSNAKGTFGAGVETYPAGSRPFMIALGDVDEDGALDVAVADESNVGAPADGTVTLLRGDGGGRLARVRELVAGRFPADVRLADVNGDRHLDVVVADWGSNDVAVFLGDGKGGFQDRSVVTFDGTSPFAVAIADVDTDGKLDLLLPDLAKPAAAVLLGDGAGRFRTGPRVPTGAGCRALAVADLNGDGHPDVASANTNANTVVIALGPGFERSVTMPAGTMPRSVAAADLNRDGRPDLVVTDMGSQSITVLLNNGTPTAKRKPAAIH